MFHKNGKFELLWRVNKLAQSLDLFSENEKSIIPGSVGAFFDENCYVIDSLIKEKSNISELWLAVEIIKCFGFSNLKRILLG